MRAYWRPILALLVLNIGADFALGQGIRVRSAYYGPSNRAGIDVTRQVQRFADYGEPFRVGNDTLQIDTYFDRPCVLVVNYELNGQQISERVPEGEVFYFRSPKGADSGIPDRGPPLRVIRDEEFAVGRGSVRAEGGASSSARTGASPYPGAS